MSKKFKLKFKLLVAFLSVGIIPFAVMAIVALNEANSALHDQAFAQMESMRDVKKGQVLDYLQTIKDQALTFSEDRMIISAMDEFSTAFKTFRAVRTMPRMDIAQRANQKLRYENRFGIDWTSLKINAMFW
ncbi:hypothetical protein [Desulfosarcina ovata]|uniref:Chemotaxis methyl-accepting receptor HlyB-like 4HB MCP domain-containing protein n=1 Tax=Desulfosarcina ovata subsp. ovata TaxID=2752305 RepID=A0A5K8AGG9_9BACT|nr:hypothetical protein [Desulfosarcina ovata]BBO91599.1 hypothetical protein DSCOOX_47790 [Desulfosarcina ovata subsp. ovata]